MATLNQKRAAKANEFVQDIAKLPDKDFKELKDNYGSLARSFPSMIQANGLGQSLAFLLAKDKGGNVHYKKLFDHVSKWLCDNIQPEQAKPGNDFLTWIINKETSVYQQATQEAIQFSIWLKRFAEAKNLGGEEENPNG
jgi:CRISPR-associated protein Cmr5